MDKHTPGPWQNDCGLVYGREPKNMSSPSFDIFDASEWPGDMDEAQANAHLIAAAPELLDALETLLTNERPEGGDIATWVNQYKAHLAAQAKARAAIAKARGEV